MALMSSRITKMCTSAAPRDIVVRCCLVVFLGIIAYSNTFRMSFTFDDATNILSNHLIREFNPEGIKQAFTTRRGIGIVSFQLNYYLSGLSVTGYHLFNLCIHLTAALLVYRLLALMLETPCFRSPENTWVGTLPVPFFAALIFVTHPIQTQAVTYIVQRFTSMATMLYLASVVAYLQARMLQEQRGRLVSVGSVSWAAACLFASLCAFNTKEIAYTLPLALMLVEWICFGLNRRKLAVVGVLSFAAVAAVLAKLGLGNVSLDQAMTAMDEATRLQTITSRSDYLFTQFRVILTYIRLLLLPINQSVDYDYTLSHGFFEPAVIGAFSVLALLFVLAIVLVRKSRSGRGDLRLVAFGLFWFFLALSIESSILPIIDLIFEHRVYLPSVGAITAVTAAGVSVAWRRNHGRFQAPVCIAFLLLAALLAGAAWKRNLVWKTEVTLWEDATAKKPRNSRAWNNLGGAYIKEKSADKALRALVRAIELDPSKAAAWNNLGIAIDLKGVYRDRFNKTKEMFNAPQSVENETVSQWLGDANNNLGLAYEILGNLPKAAENYRNATGYNPALGLAYYNLGLVSAAMGNADTYAEQQQILLLVDPILAERLRHRVGGR